VRRVSEGEYALVYNQSENLVEKGWRMRDILRGMIPI
jgi:hypothetical protein